MTGPVAVCGRSCALGILPRMDAPTALLVAGYTAAIPTTAGVLRIAWRRNVPLFGVLMAGTSMIVAGWALKGEPNPAWTNAGFGVGFVCTWVAVGRVRTRREAEQAVSR